MDLRKSRRALGLLCTALWLALPGIAVAATATQNITITGTITPPPASCSFQGGGPTLNFSGAVPTSGERALLSDVGTVSFTCTAGTSATFTQTQHYSDVSIGAGTGVVVLVTGAQLRHLFSVPEPVTGTGSVQTLQIRGILAGGTGAAPAELQSGTDFGVVSGSVPLVVSY